ncbi:merozoite surface protein 2-like isoform X2 [Paramacrobiotus metropolitanus]|uniref:merozoite surface protein 2-like isoform X2 n=1 Tax=Paramacrobiotus metropolitanus TaxID=2943436 RepID=UPI002445BE8E|nr:merozoite surface protein 2-like isoform X2 [Paramacrobiotus metropolitanus]
MLVYTHIFLGYWLLHNLSGSVHCQSTELTGPDCYGCTATGSSSMTAHMLALCKAEQRKVENAGYVTTKCSTAEMCGIIYYNTTYPDPTFRRTCIEDGRPQAILNRYPCSDLEPLVCQADTPNGRFSGTLYCVCQGKLCNWFPDASIRIAVTNSWKDKAQRVQIPPISGSGSGTSNAGSGRSPSASSAGSGTGSGAGGSITGNNPDSLGGAAGDADNAATADGSGGVPADKTGDAGGAAGGRAKGSASGGSGAVNGSDTGSTASGSGTNWALIGGIAAAPVVLGLVAVWWWHKSTGTAKHAAEHDESEEEL